MVNKMQIIAGFNRGAKSYDMAAELQMKVANRLMHFMHANEVASVLEVGCGTGLLSQKVIQRYPKASFLLTDIAPNMVKTANHRFANLPNVTTLCQDAETLVLADKFDLLISSMTMHWFSNVDESLSRLMHHLRPNGKLVFSLLGENSLQEWREMCLHMGIPVATPRFPNFEKLKQQFPMFHLKKETIVQSYQSAYAFLKSLKKLGAVATHPSYANFTHVWLRRLLDKYNHEIQITYEIIYGEFQQR